MGRRFLSVILIVVIAACLVVPAHATSLDSTGRNIVIGIVVVSAAIGAVIAVVVIHYSKKRTITGCVGSEGNAITVTDEKDKQTYRLTGHTAGVKAGDRMKLQGKKTSSKVGGNSPGWKITKVDEDLGVCHP
jgi:hypothetical protein